MQYVFTKKDAVRFDLKDPERTVYLWIDKECGAKDISGSTAEIPVNGELAYHSHEVEEIMLILRGKGVATVVEETYPLEPETMVFVPPGVKHKFRNTGSEPLAFAFFYAPPGIEQVYRRMASK